MESHPNIQQDAPLLFEKGKLLEGIKFEEYAKAPGMNAGGLKEFSRSAAHFYEARYNRVDKKETPALLMGKLVHFAVLEPELFMDTYIVKPKFDMRTKVGKADSELWETNLKPGSIVVPEDLVKDLVGMTTKILNHPNAKKLLKEGVRESTLFWDDRETGELCKARPDFVSFFKGKTRLVDLKTTMDARQSSFERDVMKYHYFLQASHYAEGARITGVANPDVFVFLVIEKTPPYEIAIYPCDAGVLGYGDQWRSKLMREYAECRKTGIYPGYNPRAQMIKIPTWAQVPDEEDDYGS